MQLHSGTQGAFHQIVSSDFGLHCVLQQSTKVRTKRAPQRHQKVQVLWCIQSIRLRRTSSRKYAAAGAFPKALEERLKGISQAEHIDINRLRRQVSFDRLLAIASEAIPRRPSPLGVERWLCAGTSPAASGPVKGSLLLSLIYRFIDPQDLIAFHVTQILADPARPGYLD